ncbi:MAG: MBL fold metallo-hydrolase [Promethearchaeota archaeon]|nr:MAG: MBL fold metallo-hydrolase [Candidatus Lokiarchaeota archaeon]
MEKEVITLKSGKLNDYLHLIDAHGYGTPRTLSVFLAEFDDCSILFDCGSSLDIEKGLRYFKKNHIPLSSFKYLITSHHHFDHNGGLWKLYEEIKKINPEVKILTNNLTKSLLNDYEHHLNRGRTTYGDLVGVMKPIQDKAFKIIQPSRIFDTDIKKLEIVENFTFNGSEIKLAILKTPGHTPDHQSPVIIKGNSIEFIFLGEAAGTIYHKSKLVTMPTSMPIYYNHEDYMNTLRNLKRLNPLMAGFGHYGVINGENNVQEIIREHESFMKKFKSLIVEYYNEKPKTRYVVEKIVPLLIPRTDLSYGHNSIFDNISVAIVYGMMMSLGFRPIPKEEMKYLN